MALQSLLVAYDGTPPSEAALARAAEIAQRAGPKITLVCAIPVTGGALGVESPPGGTIVETLDAARRMLGEARVRLEKMGIADSETKLLEGDPVDQIVEYAAQHPPDVLVVGSRGLSGTGRLLLGSVSEGILRRVHCSVLVVKTPPPRPEKRAKH